MDTYNKNELKSLVDLVDSAECGLFKMTYNSDMTLDYANDYFYTLYGYTREEYTEQFGSKAVARIHPDDAQRFKFSVARQLAMGTSLRFEHRIIKKDGSVAWLLLKANATTQEQPLSYLCSCIDITSMKESYHDLARSKFELDIISNSMPGGVVKIRVSDFKILYANNSFYNLGGYSRIEYEENFDNICIGLLHKDDQQAVKEKIEEALRHRKILSLEYRIIQRSGEIRWSYLNGSLINSDDGSPVFLCVIMDISMQKEYEKQLEMMQQKQQILSELTHETLWEYDINTDQQMRSGNLEHTFGNEPVISDYKKYLKENSIVHPDDINTYFNQITPGNSNRKHVKAEIRMKNNIGIYTWYRIQGVIIYDKNNAPVQIIGKTVDIDSTKQQFLRLQEDASHDELTRLFNQSAIRSQADAYLDTKPSDAISALILIDLDHFKIIADHYGRVVADMIISRIVVLITEAFPNELIGRINNDQFVVFYKEIPSQNEIKERANKICTSISEIALENHSDLQVTASIGYFFTKESNYTYDLMLMRANVATRTIKSRGGNGVDAYGMLYRQKQLPGSSKDDISRNYYDTLTGLYTLPAFIIEANKVIKNNTNSKSRFAILYSDINRFRTFNINYGFTVGNKILKYYARVLDESKQADELCCHIDNDHFVCLLKYKDSHELAERFNALKDRLFGKDANIEDYFRFTITAGLYIAKKSDVDINHMIDKADYARLSTKKLTDTSHYAIYTKELEKLEQAQLELENSIESAIENHEFVPYLQPKYSLVHEKPVGIEALTRWERSNGSVLLPEYFIPILERNGFIVELDFYIIEQTIKMLRKWIQENRTILPVAFNISGSHLKTSNFIERLVSLMKQYTIPIQYLELEISESVFVKNSEQLSYLIEELTDIGFKVTIDDFGKEYSSLNLLRDLPIHCIKLDNDFFHKKIQQDKERIIFKKILEMANELGIHVLCEGVESNLQANRLKEFGCDIVQGFLYHNPMCIEEFEHYILYNL